jgi:CobQ-like glutamine amidotransferase family enzyme
MKNQNLQPKTYNLTIGWLYPELMSTYGDRGNIIVLQKRCEWRDVKVEVKKLEIGYSVKDLMSCDLLFMGGAQDLQQKIVSDDLKKKASQLKTMIDDGIPGLYICGAYQFLGKYYKEADGTIIDGLGIFDLYTEHPGENAERLIGNTVVEWCQLDSSAQNDKREMLVGFENHGGRTYLGKNIKPLGTVKVGFGNNGKDKTEGAMYKNSFGSYFHGPILPKNPHFADYLIKLALEKKYKKEVELKKLDDEMELKAHEFIINRLSK